jgi:hypothetical protein
MSELPNLAVFYIEDNDKVKEILREKKRTLEGFLAERVRELYGGLEAPFSGEKLNGEDVSVPDGVIINYSVDENKIKDYSLDNDEPFIIQFGASSTVKGNEINAAQQEGWPGRIIMGLEPRYFGCNDRSSSVHRLIMEATQALTQRMSGLLISEHLDYNLRFYGWNDDAISDTLKFRNFPI